MKNLLMKSGNPKTDKGVKLGWTTYTLSLNPDIDKNAQFEDLKRAVNKICPYASNGCIASCLRFAGRGKMNSVYDSRRSKGHDYLNNKEVFMTQLRTELKKISKKKMNAVRLNTLSDINWNIWKEFPEIQFYDYTKNLKKAFESVNYENYDVTYSVSEDTDLNDVLRLLSIKINCAVVFDEVPKVWRGVDVINGDETDLRFLDRKGVIVGLSPKGLAKKDETGFKTK